MKKKQTSNKKESLSKKEQFRLEKEKESKAKKTKIWSISIIAIILVLFLIFKIGNSTTQEDTRVFGDDKIDMYYFHLNTCPHCHEQNKFNKILKEKYPQLKIHVFELTQPGTREMFTNLSKDIEGLDSKSIATPTTIIGTQFNVGYGGEDSTGKRLIEMIELQKNIIESNWDEETMTTTLELRQNEENNSKTN